MSARRYTINVQHTGGLVVRHLDFDGEHVVGPVTNLSDEPVELDDRFREFVEAMLRAHESSGHAGQPVTVHVGPS